MKGQILIIIFKDDMAFLTKEVAMDFSQVKVSDSPVKLLAPSFWKIQVINYIEEEKRLFVEVLSYQLGETEFSNDQIELADILMSVEKVTFRNIETPGLLRSFKIPAPLQETVYTPPTQPETEIEREPTRETYREPFSIPIKDVNFLSGCVAFEKKIQRLNKSIEFEISNEDIIEEYDAIKNYFATVLKTKKIEVEPTITIVDGAITSINATSREIEKIDKTLIEEVKFEIVRAARRKEPTGDQQLFAISEYIEAFSDEAFNAQHIFKDDSNFVDALLKKSETKHYNHLRFLSSKHDYDLHKLRLVHKPFSFVFLISGADKFHIVWETLDTQEATYIWSVANNVEAIKEVLTKTDKTINLILREGKNEYISRNEENFKRVFHDYTDLQNGFRNWKQEIEKIIL